MFPSKRIRRVQLIWAATLLATTLMHAEADNSKERAHINERTKWHCNRLASVDPSEYHVKLSLLDGFTTIKGKVEILLKFAGKRANCFGNKIERAISKMKTIGESDQIALHVGARLEIREVTLEVSHSMRKLAQGLGRKIPVDRVSRDDERQTASIHFKKGIPPGRFGRLSLSYRSTSMKDEQDVNNPTAKFARKPRRVLRLEPGHARQLFPCFDKPQFRSKFSVSVYQPDMDSAVVSNLPRVRQSPVINRKTGLSFEKTEFKQEEPIAVDELSFALGPFHLTPSASTRSISQVISFVPPQEGKVLKIGRFAREFLYQAFGWMQNYLATITDQFTLQGALTREHLAIGTETNSDEENVETALTMALLVARRGLDFVGSISHSDHWVHDGLAAYFAIRIVRELAPELHVDEYVRLKLLPRALDLDASGKHAPLELSGVVDPAEKSLPAVLLRSIKGAAIVDIIKRNTASNQRAFDGAILTLFKKNAFNGIGLDELADAFASSRFTSEQILELVRPWLDLEGYPYITASLDRRDGSVELDQVPISWLNDDIRRTKFDAVWPVALKVKFESESESEIRELPIFSFMNERASLRLQLPPWFDYNNPRHNFLVIFDDPTELPYYRVSYSMDLSQE